MFHLAFACFWALVGLSAYNAFWTVAMALVLRQARPKFAPDDELPKAAVLLCCRGADPSLASCLQRLIAQDYPQYDIFIAVDSKRDPAWKIVERVIRDSGARNIRVTPLLHRSTTCSLKCSSLVQLLDQLDDSHEIVVLADADLESHVTWLRELIAPFRDARIGATYGNRWFLPTRGWMGSLVRQLCNGPGIIIMHVAQIPWGGSLAIRKSVIEEGDLKAKWSTAIVDDCPARTVVKQLGLKLHFVPSLLMANREDCDLRFAFDFLRRQLTWTRTYVRAWWPLMLAYTSLSVGIWTISVWLALVCFWQGRPSEAMLFAIGPIVLSGTLTLLSIILDASARAVIKQQGEPVAPLIGPSLVKLPIALMWAAGVHMRATLEATVRRKVVWRGVTYEIHGPWKIHMHETPTPHGQRTSPGVSV